MSCRDASLISFANSLETLNDEEQFEVVFHNKSLSQTLSSIPKDGYDNDDSSQCLQWQQFIQRSTLENKALRLPISIVAIAQNRYSQQLLDYVHLNDTLNDSQRSNQPGLAL